MDLPHPPAGALRVQPRRAPAKRAETAAAKPAAGPEPAPWDSASLFGEVWDLPWLASLGLDGPEKPPPRAAGRDGPVPGALLVRRWGGLLGRG